MIRAESRAATVLVGATGVLLLGSSAAYAVWTTTGSGTGEARATTFAPPVVVAGTAPAGQLYPGLTANGTSTGGTLVVRASNPNPFPITVTLTSGGTPTGCTTTGVALRTSPAITISLAANAPAADVSIAHAVSMSSASSDDCQGAIIIIPLSTAAVSS